MNEFKNKDQEDHVENQMIETVPFWIWLGEVIGSSIVGFIIRISLDWVWNAIFGKKQNSTIDSDVEKNLELEDKVENLNEN